MKNGKTFTIIIDNDQFASGIWEPFYYRDSSTKQNLGQFVEVRKISDKCNMDELAFEPIEYKDIPKGYSLGFNLTSKCDNCQLGKMNFVAEESLLFGTMRAYLGNIIITPKSEWLNLTNLKYPINSEFVEIIPIDGFVYFWWAFLKSHSFLSTLPTGTGGTRPRSNIEQLKKTPILIPDIEIRQKINEYIRKKMERFWTDYFNIQNFLSKYEII